MKTFLEHLNKYDGLYDNLSEEEQIKKILENPSLIRFICNPSKKLQIIAVKERASSIQHIKKPCLEAQRISVLFDSYNINLIENPNTEIQKLAIQDNAWNVVYISHPGNNILIMAILKDPELLDITKFEKLPKKVQEGILEKRPDLITKIQNLDPDLAKQYNTSQLGGQTGFF